MPDKPVPRGTIADPFNDGHSPAPQPFDPSKRTMGLDRANDTARRIDSIIVKPLQLSLAVGDTVSLKSTKAISWVAMDTAKRIVRDFWPVFSVSDSSIVRVDRSRLTALRAGACNLFVSATVPDSATRRLRILRTTRVSVVVR